MTDWRTEERARREAAADDEVVLDSLEPIEEIRVPQLVSVRFDPDMIAALRDLATRQGTTVSALVRESVSKMLTDESERQRSHVSMEIHIDLSMLENRAAVKMGMSYVRSGSVVTFPALRYETPTTSTTQGFVPNRPGERVA